MTNRQLCTVITAGLLTGSLTSFAPATARAQGTTALPGKGEVTLVGCLLNEGEHDRYILANTTVGPATSVPEASCSATGTGETIKLERMKKHHLNVVNVGQWVEVSGKLEKNQQEMHVKSVRAVPVVVPRAAEVLPIPEAPRTMPAQPAPMVETPAPTAPPPIATTGVVEEKKARRLPKTASQLPLIEFVGLLALPGGLALLVDGRRNIGRG